MTPQYDPQPLERFPTGISGFEPVSKGGLVRGRASLVVGTSGSGKTLFCMETAFHHLQAGGKALVVAFEERPEDVVRNTMGFGWRLDECVADGTLRFLDATFDPDIVEQSGQFDLGGLGAVLLAEVDDLQPELVILDSTSAILEQYANSPRMRHELVRLTHELTRRGVTLLLTAERLQEYGRITRHGVEDFISDCVVVLRQILEEHRVRRTVQVYKLRGGAHYNDEFPFVIGEDGLSVLPLSAMRLSQGSLTDRVSVGNQKLDDMFSGGVFANSIILVSGPTGAGKTLIGSQFAAEGCRNGERVLYLGYEESKPQLVQNAGAWGIDFDRWEDEGTLRILCRYPESLGWAEHLRRITREVEEFQPSRIVIDSVSSLERIATKRDFREFIVAMTSMVKSANICTVLTSTTPRLTGGDSITDAHISTITDAILLLRYVELDAELRRGMLVIKMRGSQHDKNVHSYSIDSEGLHVEGPFEEIPGLILGVPSPQSFRADDPA